MQNKVRQSHIPDQRRLKETETNEIDENAAGDPELDHTMGWVESGRRKAIKDISGPIAEVGMYYNIVQFLGFDNDTMSM